MEELFERCQNLLNISKAGLTPLVQTYVSRNLCHSKVASISHPPPTKTSSVQTDSQAFKMQLRLLTILPMLVALAMTAPTPNANAKDVQVIYHLL